MPGFKMNTGGDRPVGDLCPAGALRGRFLAIYDLGTHEEDTDKGPKDRRKLYIAWEVYKKKEDGSIGVYTISNRYTFSLLGDNNKLKTLVQNIEGRKLAKNEDYDISTLLRKPCTVNVTHTQVGDKTYANVSGVAQIDDELIAHLPKMKNPVVLWETADGFPAPAIDYLPWCYGQHPADIAGESREAQAVAPGRARPHESTTTQSAATVPPSDDDIPW